MKNFLLGWIIIAPVTLLVVSVIIGISYGLFLLVTSVSMYFTVPIGLILFFSFIYHEEIYNVGKDIRESRFKTKS